MSLVENLNLINTYKGEIRQAIQDKGVDMTNVPLSGYASKIGDIQTGSDPVLVEKDITENGTYVPDEGVDGFSKVNVNVPQEVDGYTLKDVLETGIRDSYLYDASITSVRNFAMYSNSNVVNIDLPNVTYIGTNAFYNCTSLQTVNMPNVISISTSAFVNCSSLQSIDFPNVKSIGNSAFLQCNKMKMVNIPNVKSIGSYAFQNCSSLQEINFSNVEYIDTSVFTYCSSLQSANMPNVSSIRDNAFASCYLLQTVNAPNVRTIGNAAFTGCSSLQSIDLPNVISISGYTFRNCYALQTVNIPFASSIGTSAFEYCSSLSSITIGTDLYYVASLANTGVFANSPMSKSTYLGYFGSIYVPAALESEYKSATNWVSYSNRIVGVGDPSDIVLKMVDNSLIGRYSGALYNTDLTRLKLNSSSELYTIDLPNVSYVSGYVFASYKKLQTVNMSNVEKIDYSTFYNCTSLQSVNIPNATIIGYGAFSSCNSLQTVNMSNVTSIHTSAFAYCSSLQSIDLPNINFIGQQAFNYCKSLISVIVGMNLSYVPELGYDVFAYTPITNSTFLGYFGSIYVPASLVDTYKTAQYWRNYKDRIVGI